MNKIIANNIKFLIKDKNFNLIQLSSLAGLSISIIESILHESYTPSIEEVSLLAKALKIPVYWLFLPFPNFLSSWHLTLEELSDMVIKNPSLRGFMVGYMAESKIRSYFIQHPEISNIYKPDDHDRTNKCDLVLSYKGREFSFEIKSLQTNTVRPNKTGQGLVATFQCDASDCRIITLPNGHTVSTTCLQFGDFDIVAINLFAFTNNWDYAFALNKDLPHASQSRSKNTIIKEDLQYLIKSSIRITFPLQAPFVSDPFILMNRLLQDNPAN